jgi:hypothetical protein
VHDDVGELKDDGCSELFLGKLLHLYFIFYDGMRLMYAIIFVIFEYVFYKIL